MPGFLLVCVAVLGAVDLEAEFRDPPQDARPQTWFHLIGGNVSKAGLTADLEALRDAGIGGIQLFHGQVGADRKWSRTGERIPCLSAKWDGLIGPVRLLRTNE